MKQTLILTLLSVGSLFAQTFSVSPSTNPLPTQTFTFTFTSATAFSQLHMLFTPGSPTSSAGAKSCYLMYVPGANQLYLADDTGSVVASPGIAPGSTGTLANSQCSVNTASVTATPTAGGITLSVPISFLPAFAGTQSIWMYSFDANNVGSGWTQEGTWTVGSPAGSGTPGPQGPPGPVGPAGPQGPPGIAATASFSLTGILGPSGFLKPINDSNGNPVSFDVNTVLAPGLPWTNNWTGANSFAGSFQIVASATDPGTCAQAPDVGHIWVSTADPANTKFNVCEAVSGAVQWVTK